MSSSRRAIAVDGPTFRRLVEHFERASQVAAYAGFMTLNLADKGQFDVLFEASGNQRGGNASA